MISQIRSRYMWWIALGLILSMAALPRLVTYNFSLPYIGFGDEASLYWWASDWRTNTTPPRGYPPAFLVESNIVQVALQQMQREGEASTVSVLRFLSIITQLLTIIVVALTARKISGNLAGIIAALIWATLSIFLTYTVATADPPAYLFAMIALWLAVVASVDSTRQHWCVWSVAVALLSMLFKYPTVVSVAPGGLVALYIFFHNRRRGLYYLIVQGTLVAATALFLVFGYGAFALIKPSNGMGSSAGLLTNLSSYFKVDLILENIGTSIGPLHLAAFIGICVLAGIVFIIAPRSSWQRIKIGPFALCLVLFFLVCWITPIFTLEARERDLLPAVSVACIILGVAIAQINNALAQERWLVLRFGLVAVLIGLIFVPEFVTDAALVHTRQLPDRRVVWREWTDTNLDGGTMLVDPDDQSFNYHESGITGRKSFDWWDTKNVMSEPIATWRQKYGISYMSIPRGELIKMQGTPEGQAYLAQLLHLRDFFAPPVMVGPEVAFYRLWRMQVATNVHFGNSISLAGYDVNTTSLAPGDSIQFRLYWQAATRPLVNYSMYIHLSSLSTHDLLAQIDGSPSVPGRPTSTWDDPAENLISPVFRLTIPKDLPTGHYRVLIGLYDSATGQRLLTSQGEDASLLFPVDIVREF